MTSSSETPRQQQQHEIQPQLAYITTSKVSCSVRRSKPNTGSLYATKTSYSSKLSSRPTGQFFTNPR